MLPKVYISAPVLCSWTEITQIIERFDKKTVEVNYWDRKKHYDSSLLKTSDILVIVHPLNRFSFKESELPSGVLKEVRLALDLRKPIFIAYKNANKEYNFYDVDYYSEERYFTGVKGSSNVLTNLILALTKARKQTEKIKEPVFLDKIDHFDFVVKNPCAEISLPEVYHYTEPISDVTLDNPDPRLLLLIT